MASDPHLGRVIDNKYRIDAVIGAGGMATIYRATRLHIGDLVAIKVLHPEFLREPKFTERFQREAQAAARLKHPNVVTIHDFGVCDDGLIYIVMELVEGPNQRTIIKERGPMGSAHAATIVRQVCAALTEAHRQGIIHRDIKPANIAVTETPDGPHVKVLDFGIASLRGGETMMTFTQTGAVLGTPAYMSPEQCLGEDLDARSDIYSLGIVLFEMLCGVVPFNSPTATAVVMQHVQQAPPQLRVLNASVSPAMERVVLRALAKRREDRQQTARELADELTAAVGSGALASFSPSELDRTMVQSPVRAAQYSSVPPAPQPPHSARRSGATGVLIGLALAAVFGTLWFGAQRLLWNRAPSARTVAAKPALPRPTLVARVAPAPPGAPVAPPVRAAAVTPPVVQDQSAPGADVLSILYQTREMDVLGSSGCGTNEAVLIRFRDDGTGGCAWHTAAVRGPLESGENVILVPVTAAGRGLIYDLGYSVNGSRARFIGLYPGDGSGNLRVSLENGFIVERNGYREKRSTLRNGHAVPAAAVTTAATGEADAVVREYYSLWDAHRFPEAYGLLSTRYQAEHPYSDWLSSHAAVVRISARTAPTTDPMVVAVSIRSLDRTPSGITDTQYQGTWTAVRENGTTKLDEVALNRTQ